MKAKSILNAVIFPLKKGGVMAIILSISTILLMAQTLDLSRKSTNQDEILGNWVSKAGDSKMQIFKIENKFGGRLLEGWGNQMFEKDGVTLKRDIKNKDVRLRNRALKNMEFISGLTYQDGRYVGGKLYIAQAGRAYSCKMKIVDGKLIARLYAWVPLFGVNKIFTRID